MSTHTIPQLQKLIDTGGVEEAFVQLLIDNVINNIEEWQGVGEGMLEGWDDDSKPQIFE